MKIELNLKPSDIDEMRKCAMRELKLREWVYPKRIEAGKMTQEKADFELAGQKKIVEHLNWLIIHAQPEQMKLL